MARRSSTFCLGFVSCGTQRRKSRRVHASRVSPRPLPRQKKQRGRHDHIEGESEDPIKAVSGAHDAVLAHLRRSTCAEAASAATSRVAVRSHGDVVGSSARERAPQHLVGGTPRGVNVTDRLGCWAFKGDGASPHPGETASPARGAVARLPIRRIPSVPTVESSDHKVCARDEEGMNDGS